MDEWWRSRGWCVNFITARLHALRAMDEQRGCAAGVAATKQVIRRPALARLWHAAAWAAPSRLAVRAVSHVGHHAARPAARLHRAPAALRGVLLPAQRLTRCRYQAADLRA